MVGKHVGIDPLQGVADGGEGLGAAEVNGFGLQGNDAPKSQTVANYPEESLGEEKSGRVAFDGV